MTDTQSTPTKTWRIHDWLFGLLGGGSAGGVLGLIASVRNNDSLPIIWTGVALGAAIGVFGLLRSHREGTKFLNAVVVAAWLGLLLSVLFMFAIVMAFKSF